MRVTTEQALKIVPHLAAGEPQLIVVTGMRGYGKSYFMEHYVEDREPRVLVLDVHSSFHRIRESESIDAALDAMSDGGPKRRRLVPPIENGRNARTFGDEFFAACVDRYRDGLLVIEEASIFFDNMNLKGSAIEAVILQGRHHGNRIMLACQRLARIPGEFLSEATTIISFHVRRPKDLKVLEEWGWENPREEAPRLKVGECEIIEV